MLRFSCINHAASQVHPILDGQMIRTSYLLGDEVWVEGTSYAAIEFEKTPVHPPARIKKQMVLEYVRRNHADEPLYLQEVQRMYDTLKRGKQNIKHASKEMIVAQKKVEKMLEQLYQGSINESRRLFLEGGYPGLLPLVESGEIVLKASDDEHPESAQENLVPYSDYLRQYWTNDITAYSFLDPFWHYLNEEKIMVSRMEGAARATEVLLFPLPDLPLLNGYTTAELRMLRQEVFADLLPFRQAVAEWKEQLLNDRFRYKNFDAYRDFYKSRILPYVEAAEKKWNHHALIQKAYAAAGEQKAGCYNFLALCTAETAWDYMETIGMVPKESMLAFENSAPDNCDPEKTMLLLAGEGYGEEVPQEEMGDKQSLQF